jgi:hypothetical protein
MSGEVTVPLLPCASVDEIVSFLRGAGVSADVPAAAAEPVRDGAAGGLGAALLRDRGVRRGGLVRQLCRAGARCRRGARGVRGGAAGAVREGAGGGDSPDDPASAAEERGEPVRFHGGRSGRELDPDLPGRRFCSGSGRGWAARGGIGQRRGAWRQPGRPRAGGEGCSTGCWSGTPMRQRWFGWRRWRTGRSWPAGSSDAERLSALLSELRAVPLTNDERGEVASTLAAAEEL